jgi:phage/plasmid-like protein (TIGR03299 family)
MAHNLYQNAITGKFAMFALASWSVWHDKETNVARANDVLTSDEAIALASNGYTVEKHQNRNIFDNSLIPSWSTYRMDTNAWLGDVGSSYKVHSVQTMAKLMDTCLESIGGSHYVSGGALGRGERVWLAARIPSADFEVTTGDKHEAYLVGSTSYNGLKQSQLALMLMRVVCENTLEAGLNSAIERICIRHTTNSDDKIKQAEQIMTGVAQSVDSIKTKLQTLATRRVTKDSLETVIAKLFGNTKTSDDKASTRTENIVKELLANYESNDRNAFPEQKGTAFNLLNAVTDYVDHSRSTRLTDRMAETSQREKLENQSRAASAMFGSGSQLKSQALDVILQATAGASTVTTYYPTVAPSTSLLDSILANS